MGTNYYTDEPEKCPTCGHEPDERTHIGKSSGGWRFCFQSLPDKGLTSWRAWKAYLRNRIIVDEYGRRVDFADFESLVEGKQELQWDKKYCWLDEQGYEFNDRDFS